MNYSGYIEVVGINPFRTQTLGVDIRTNIQDQIAQKQRQEMEKKEQEQQRKSMEEQLKWADAMVRAVEKVQPQESVDLNSYEEQKALREKALELAIESYGDIVQEYDNSIILDTAQRFYTYITKGE